jgi:hypothetical protein
VQIQGPVPLVVTTPITIFPKDDEAGMNSEKKMPLKSSELACRIKGADYRRMAGNILSLNAYYKFH